MNGVLAVLEWIAASYWHAFLTVLLVSIFRPVRINTINRKDNDHE